MKLPTNPSLEWLRKAAKDLLAELQTTQPDARLADAQLAIARRYGYPSWRKLKAFVDGVHDDGARLRAAVRANDLTTVRATLDDEPSLVDLREDLHERERPSDEPQMSLVHLAVAEGHAEMIELLIARGAPLDTRNAGGRTPLLDAFELGRDAIAEQLIAAGAPIDVCAAAAFRRRDRLEEILRSDPAQANDLSTGISPIGWATYAGDVEAVRLLLAHGAVVDRPPFDVEAWGPASHVAQVAVARELLAHGADPNCADADGNTPLHRVVASRIVADPTELVHVLLEAGADPDRENRAGRSPLAEALAHAGDTAETYFPKRPLGPKRLERAIGLMRSASRASVAP
jgi:hypothetical protein